MSSFNLSKIRSSYFRSTAANLTTSLSNIVVSDYFSYVNYRIYSMIITNSNLTANANLFVNRYDYYSNTINPVNFMEIPAGNTIFLGNSIIDLVVSTGDYITANASANDRISILVNMEQHSNLASSVNYGTNL
jgi:hypothetical protein